MLGCVESKVPILFIRSVPKLFIKRRVPRLFIYLSHCVRVIYSSQFARGSTKVARLYTRRRVF